MVTKKKKKEKRIWKGFVQTPFPKFVNHKKPEARTSRQPLGNVWDLEVIFTPRLQKTTAVLAA